MEIKQLINNNPPPLIKARHDLALEGRTKARISGVENVLFANEEHISLITTEGNLNMFGRTLKMQKFSIEEGTIVIEGIIDSFKYSGVKTPLIKRMFR